MMIVASLAVLSLLPYQALSLGEGVSATDKRADISLHIFVNIPKTLYTEGKLRTTGTTGKENDFTCPDRWGYFADPKNCIKYYVCKEGIPTRMTCQKKNGIQLHYNEDKVWCDWPDKVNCGNRPICDINDENCE